MATRRMAVALPAEWRENEADLMALVEIAKKYDLTAYLIDEGSRFGEVEKHLAERHSRSEDWRKAVADDLEWILLALGRVCALRGISLQQCPWYDEVDTQTIKRVGDKLCSAERLQL